MAMTLTLTPSAMTQKDYRPTPYRDSVWPIVGVRLKDRSFTPLELEVVSRRTIDVDPMFEDFSPAADAEKDHSSTSCSVPDVHPLSALEEAKVQALIDEGVQRGREAGIREGREEAEREAAAVAEASQRRVSEFQCELERKIGGVLSNVEKRAVEIALAVAKKILTTTAELEPEYIFPVIRQALGSSGGATPIRVRISPVDLDFIKVTGLPDDLVREEAGVTYVADESISSGCVVETDYGEIDARLESMWEQVRECLMEVLK